MGFKVSWIAARSLSKADLLACFDLSDKGADDEYHEAPFSCAELPTDWTILFSNDCEWSDGKCLVLPTSVSAIACALHEGVMWSEASAFEGGRRVWHVVHDSQTSIFDLKQDGEIPADLRGIGDEAVRQQDEAGGASAGVDLVFDVPIDMAMAICGWRHDLCEFDWGTPHFTVVEPATAG